MIVRVWRARARKTSENAYVEHFRKKVQPELRRIQGFLGASLLKESRVDDVEFLVLTRWSSMDAIRAFAGDDVTQAVVEPAAAAALSEFDRTVQHFELVEDFEV